MVCGVDWYVVGEVGDGIEAGGCIFNGQSGRLYTNGPNSVTCHFNMSPSLRLALALSSCRLQAFGITLASPSALGRSSVALNGRRYRCEAQTRPSERSYDWILGSCVLARMR
jgi:hypothetical protein